MKGFGYLIKEGFKNIWHNKMMSLASVGVLICCMILTGSAVLISLNVQHVIDDAGDSNVINIYLVDTTPEEETAIENELKSIDNITSVEFYSKEEAIKDFEEDLGDAFEQMQGDDNPLPDAFKVQFEDLSLYEDTVSQIKAIDGVDQVSDTREIAEKLTSLSTLVNYIGIAIVVILGLISFFIISNTIRMTMYSRRFEISIMKSVGATNRFVRIPFLVEGVILGVLAATISSVALAVCYDLIMNTANRIIAFEFLNYSNFIIPISCAFLASGILMGLMSGILSIKKYLKKEGNSVYNK